jgi:hypothetical protein
MKKYQCGDDLSVDLAPDLRFHAGIMLTHTFTKRMTIVLVILPLVVGLISLGWRLPTLSGGLKKNGPKPRPRAVLQTQISKCNKLIKHAGTAHASAWVIVAVPARLVPECAIGPRPLWGPDVPRCCPSIYAALVPSRASPHSLMV